MATHSNPCSQASEVLQAALASQAPATPPDATQELVVALDTLVSGVHFPTHTPPADIGYKALAVNLSDLAAMGAKPYAASVLLTLPSVETSWLEAFSAGFVALAEPYGLHLLSAEVGSGTLSVTVQAIGSVPPGMALPRGGAETGDGIYVSGFLGDAGVALEHHYGRLSLAAAHLQYFQRALSRPVPRVALGQQLRGVASAAIDLSDGLSTDLVHLLGEGAMGAQVEVASLPVSAQLMECVGPQVAWDLALSAGDDYELCFCAEPHREPELTQLGKGLGVPLTRIGFVVPGTDVEFTTPQGTRFEARGGYQHFVPNRGPGQ